MAKVEPFLVDGVDPRGRWHAALRPPLSLSKAVVPVIAFAGLVALSPLSSVGTNVAETPPLTWVILGAIAAIVLVVSLLWFAPDAGVTPFLIARRTRRGWHIGRSFWARLGLKRVVVPEGRPCEVLVRTSEEALGIQFYDWILTGGGRTIELKSTLAPAPAVRELVEDWSKRSGVDVTVVVE